MARTVLKDRWLVQAFQHGRRDTCKGGTTYDSEAEAMEAAKNWAEEITFDQDTEHEAVVYRAVASVRGTRLTTVRRLRQR